jgi:phosphoribulokinase
MYWQQMLDAYSVRVYLDPPERLRYHWKVRRDTALRGYKEDEVLHELALRERDSERYIWPQRNKADVIVTFFRTQESADQKEDASSIGQEEDDAHLNVRLTLHGTLHHPDFSEVIAEDTSGCVRSRLGREGGRAVEYLEIDGSIPDEPARALERCILDHLDACGVTSVANLGLYYDPDTRHSHPLALTQLFLVYHLLRAQQHDNNLT